MVIRTLWSLTVLFAVAISLMACGGQVTTVPTVAFTETNTPTSTETSAPTQTSTPTLTTTSTPPAPLATATPATATAVGRIVLGYGDHSPVPDLPLWLGKEGYGKPVTRTNANGEFTLTGLPVGQVIDVVDDHLFFQINVTSVGVIDLGTLEYPLIHP